MYWHVFKWLWIILYTHKKRPQKGKTDCEFNDGWPRHWQSRRHTVINRSEKNIETDSVNIYVLKIVDTRINTIYLWARGTPYIDKLIKQGTRQWKRNFLYRREGNMKIVRNTFINYKLLNGQWKRTGAEKHLIQLNCMKFDMIYQSIIFRTKQTRYVAFLERHHNNNISSFFRVSIF